MRPVLVGIAFATLDCCIHYVRVQCSEAVDETEAETALSNMQVIRGTLDNGLRVVMNPDQHGPDRRGVGVLRRRVPERSQGPIRLRAPLRTHDVSGFSQRWQGRTLRPDHQSRWERERYDQQRPDELLRNAPRQRARARALARGRPDALTCHHAGQLRKPAPDRDGGATPAHRQSAVHPEHASHQRACVRRLLAIRALDHRRHAGPDRCAPRGGSGVLRHPLRTRTTRC